MQVPDAPSVRVHAIDLTVVNEAVISGNSCLLVLVGRKMVG